MNIINKAIKAVKQTFAEKKEKFINKSVQGFFADQRAAALKNLFDPKAKLSGAQKRRLLEQTGRPLDPSEGYTYTAPKPAGERWFRRLMGMSLRRLIRFDTRSKHNVTGLEIRFAKMGSRQQRLAKPAVEYAKLVKKAVGDVLLFRIVNVKATETK